MKVYFLFGVLDQLFSDFIGVYNQQFPDTPIEAYGFAYAKNPCFAGRDIHELMIWSNLLNTLEPIDVEFLKKMEGACGMTIADLIHLDRHLMRFEPEHRLVIAFNLIRRFMNSIEKHNIPVVFSSGIADLISVFACQYAQQTKQFKFFCLMHARLEDLHYLSNGLDNRPAGFAKSYEHHYQNMSSAEIVAMQKYWQNYATAKKVPTYMADKTVLFNVIRLSDFKRFYDYFKAFYRDKKGLHYEQNPWLLPYYRLLRSYRAYTYKQELKRKVVDPKQLPKPYEKYYVFPLHFHPESATLVLGKALHDQIRVIEMISKALPADTVLLVKEHKVSIGRRARSFFKQIAAFHNVFFVNEHTHVQELLKGSQGVFTISSTMGFEALMMNKKVYCIGKVFYNLSKNVFPITKIDEIGIILKETEHKELDQKSPWALLKALVDSSFSLGTLSAKNYNYDQLGILAYHFNKTAA